MGKKKNNQNGDDSPESDLGSEVSKITEMEKKCEDYLSGWQRAQADLVNYKKDESRRMEGLVKFANEVILVELISFMDEYDIALGHLPKKVRNENKEWASGLDSIVKKFSQFLEKMGIKKIKTVGEVFDPLKHESVGQVEYQGSQKSKDQGQKPEGKVDVVVEEVQASSGQADKVVEEVQAGYEMHGKVIRPAKIKIAS